MKSGELCGGVTHPWMQLADARPLVRGGLLGSPGGVGDTLGEVAGDVTWVELPDGESLARTIFPAPQEARTSPETIATSGRPIRNIRSQGGYRATDSLVEMLAMADPLHTSHVERDERHRIPVSRRKFLERSAMAIAGSALFSCTHHGRVIQRVTDTVSTRVQTRTPIKRVVYLMLENRSFDNVFGRFPGVNGVRFGVEFGKEVPLRPCPDWLPGDLPHDHAAALNCLNDGKMDGFGTGIYGPYFAYTQLDEQQIPNYWTWAREYAISDNFFASAFGPSYPNHFFAIAGQSGGAIDNPENIGVANRDGGKFKSWGCDAIPQKGSDVFVFVKDGLGNMSKHTSCFDFETVGEQLTHGGIDWAFYSAPPGQAGYFWNAYNGVSGVFHTDLWHEHVRDVNDVLRDISANRLPAVSWVTPRFELSDHPPFSTSGAHNWVTDVVNAIMKSDMWEQTAIFLTWDEWGGFYDHVTPKPVDPVGLGYRVPLLTISPFTRRGLIDDVLGEFSTPLRFVADNWGLDYLTPRIANTHNLDHIFDFKANPRPPAFAKRKVKTYGGNPLSWPFTAQPTKYSDWPAGTVPVSSPL